MAKGKKYNPSLKMFTTDVSKNFQNNTTQSALTFAATGALSMIPYVVIPSLLKLKSYTAMGVGSAATYALGAAFNVPGMIAGAFALPATHLLLSKGSGTLSDMGVTPWQLAPQYASYEETTPADSNSGAGGLPVRGLRSRLNGSNTMRNRLGASRNRLGAYLPERKVTQPVSGKPNLGAYLPKKEQQLSNVTVDENSEVSKLIQ